MSCCLSLPIPPAAGILARSIVSLGSLIPLSPRSIFRGRLSIFRGRRLIWLQTPLPAVAALLGNASVRSISKDSNISVTMSSPADIKLLVGEEDKYGGVIVTNVEWPVEVATFVGCLKASIAKWREEGKRGVWLKLPIDMASLVPVAVQEGFWYHHAEPTYLMLVYWIPNTPHTLPSNASHRVGVGALVVNSKKEVLVVQEKDGFFGGTGVWKIPTGVIEEGEDISVGAVREVHEETGVETEFLELLTLRHLHHSYFTKSDLFFICVLRPLSLDIVKREEEIEDAQWMPFEEFYNQPFMQKHDIMRKSSEICKSWIDGRSQGFTPERVLGELPCCFYFSQRDAGTGNKD